MSNSEPPLPGLDGIWSQTPGQASTQSTETEAPNLFGVFMRAFNATPLAGPASSIASVVSDAADYGAGIAKNSVVAPLFEGIENIFLWAIVATIAVFLFIFGLYNLAGSIN